MFTPPIDPPKPAIVPTAQPRHAEANDAKMAIRHHEEQPGKKKDQDSQDKTSAFGAIDDDMVLSVQALIDFLENFIRTQRESGAGTGRTSGIQSATYEGNQIPDQTPPQTTPQSAHAANAYAHAASVRTPYTPHVTTHTEGPSAAADEATGPELRRAMGLVGKLRALDARGIPGIHLAPGPDFLASLEAAIDAA